MIGEIDHQADIDLYLEADEVERLSKGTIEGVLVKIRKPKRQGTIRISINDTRKKENGSFGIGFDDSKYWGVQEGFHIDVFLGSEWYSRLKERGVIDTRQSMLDGSKIYIYDRSRLDNTNTMRLQDLEFYRNNKDRLPEYFG